MHADLDELELRIYSSPGAAPVATVPVGALVGASTFPGVDGERFIRIEADVEPSPLMFSLRAAEADSLADQVNRAIRL